MSKMLFVEDSEEE